MRHARLSCSFMLFPSLVPRSRYYRLRFRLEWLLAIAGIHPLPPTLLEWEDEAGLSRPHRHQYALSVSVRSNLNHTMAVLF